MVLNRRYYPVMLTNNNPPPYSAKSYKNKNK